MPKRGETLAGISERTGNQWSLEETAIANNLPSGAVIPVSRPIKIVKALPYQP